MNKFPLFVLFVAFTTGVFAQNSTKIDDRLNKTILHGRVTLEAFNMDVCKDWYSPEYKSYQIKPGVLKKLQNRNLEGITISLVLGSWCHDTHREVPRFIKILDAISFPYQHLNMNALDTHKTSPDFDTKAYQITRVPTAIVYRNGKEIGRIIESPKKSLEKDLLKILSKK